MSLDVNHENHERIYIYIYIFVIYIYLCIYIYIVPMELPALLGLNLEDS